MRKFWHIRIKQSVFIKLQSDDSYVDAMQASVYYACWAQLFDMDASLLVWIFLLDGRTTS
jgi:hypothetical protein